MLKSSQPSGGSVP